MNRIVKMIFAIGLCANSAQSQVCTNTVLASKAFPSAATNLIWKSNRPAEYLYPGESVHVVVTGQVNLAPEKKSEDRGGVLGFFSERVEWVEDHWLNPTQKQPKFVNVSVVAGSQQLNPNGSFECDLLIPFENSSLVKQTLLEVSVLNENELSGSGGLSTGEYVFNLRIDNNMRARLVQQEISSKLSGWGNKAVERLRELIDEDDRLKCMHAAALAETIFTASAGLEKKLKQQTLQYANSLDPQNHDIIIALAQTYSGNPGGCEKQIRALSDNGITRIDVNPSDFKMISNSAKAFDILAAAYFECSDDFRDNNSLDSVRQYYKLASNQYGMIFNYPKQIEMAIMYANLEADNNDKNEMLNAARFLEEIWASVPQNIDSVGEEERKAFFGKFGNTRHAYYRDVKKHITLKLEQTNNPLQDQLKDQIEITFTKQPGSSINVQYVYKDKYRVILDGNRQEVHQNVLRCEATLNRQLAVTAFRFNVEPDNVTGIVSKSEEATFQQSANFRSALPGVTSAFIRLLDLPQFCPEATINGRHITHSVTHPKGDFQLLYFTGEPVYSIKMEKSFAFIGLSDESALLSANRGTAQTTDHKLILNSEVVPTVVDGFGIIWKFTSIDFK